MTTATQNTEAQVGQRTIKNFKASPDVENFYRFIYENDLRREAKMVLEKIIATTKKPSKRGRKKRSKKVLH